MNKSEQNSKFFAIALPVLIVAILTYQSIGSILADCLRNLDRELMQLSVAQAETLSAYSGAYSRFEFRHPGPVIFYFLALVQNIFPHIDSHAISRVSMLALHLALLPLCLIHFQSILRTRCIHLLLLPAFLYYLSLLNTSPLLDYWNPNFVPVFYLLFLLSCASLIAGKLWHLPLSLVLGSVCLQAHIGSTPSVLLLIGISLLSLILRKQKSKLALPFLSSILLLGLLWWGPIYEAYQSPGDNNIRDILSHFSVPGGRGSWSDALGFYFRLFSLPVFSGPIGTLIIVVLLHLLPFGLALEPSAEKKALLLVYLASLLSCAVASTFITGDYRSYLLSQQLPTAALGLVLSVYCLSKYATIQSRLIMPGVVAVASLSFFASVHFLPAPPEVKNLQES